MAAPPRKRARRHSLRGRARRALRLPLRALARWRARRRVRGGHQPARLDKDFLRLHGQPLNDPPTVPADRAAHMRDDDAVLGVALGGEALAYPWWVVDNHHFVNDTVGGRALAIAFCEVCTSATAFDPVVDGRRLWFRLGYVFNGTNAFTDDETASVWSPYLAMALEGPLRGTRLDRLPLAQMEWAAWRELHPDTRVVVADEREREGHGSSRTPGSAEASHPFQKSVARWDERLPFNTLVLGVVGEHAEKVFPLEYLAGRGGVVNDTLGAEPIVVLHHVASGSYGALAFSRRVDARTLTFEATAAGLARDEETGSRWTFEGEAVDGPLAGTRLRFVASHVSEFYVWGAHFPDIEIAG